MALAAAEEEMVLTSNDAELVRWCEPYADDILRHHIRNERKTLPSSFADEDRLVIVNWMCNVTRRAFYKSETFWTAVSALDRYMSITYPFGSNYTSTGRNDIRGIQCIAAACIQLAASYQETALDAELADLVLACGSRYQTEQIRTACWKVVVALRGDLYWPSPLTFYRHYSRHLQESALIHTMTKFIIETMVFARDQLMLRFWPSMLAACALFLGQICVYHDLPPVEWIARWRQSCFSSLTVEDEDTLQRCLIAVAEWLRNVFTPKSDLARDIDSVVRKYSHSQLFSVSQRAALPDNISFLLIGVVTSSR